nr:odorant binding protein [Semanotus bifasciatus]
MKYCVLVFLCMAIPSVICVSDEIKKLIETLHTTCVAETGVDEALIKKTNSEKAIPDDEKLKCYLKCIMVQSGCMSDDGIIDEEATIAAVPDEHRSKSEPIIRACGTKVGANPCENAWLTNKCYMEKAPEDYILI